MSDHGAKLPDEIVGAASLPAASERVVALVQDFHESLRVDMPPDEMLSRGVEVIAAIVSSFSIADESLPAWGWVLEPVFGLPRGWATPGGDAEGAAMARECFGQEQLPAIITIPAAATILALPVPGQREDGVEVPAAVIAVPLAADIELGEYLRRRLMTAARLIGMEMENSTRGRAGQRALQLARLTTRVQQALVVPTDLVTALKVALNQYETFDDIVAGSAHLVDDGVEKEIARFGNHSGSAIDGGLHQAEIHEAHEHELLNIRFPVTIDGILEGLLRVSTVVPLGPAERDILGSVAIVVAGTAVRHRANETIETLRRSTTRRLVEAQERERSVIAADIHDGVLQQLGATAIRLELAQSRVDQKDFAAARRIITDGAEEIRSCARELRALLMELRPQVLDDNGINAALSELGRHVAGVKVEVDSSVPEDLGSEFAITIFRIVQEALTNIEKHASASSAKVRVALEGSRVTIDVEDDGIGYEGAQTGPSAEGSHLGLLGMRERAQMFGGSFRISGITGGGTALHAELPLGKSRLADS